MNRLFIFESSGICIILLSWILFFMLSDIDKQMQNVLFIKLLVADLAIIIAEIPSYLLNGVPGSASFYFNNIFSALVYALSGFVCMYWFFYLSFIIESFDGRRKKKVSPTIAFLERFPAFFLAFLSLLSPWLEFIFYVNPMTNLKYHGSLLFLQRLITYGYTTTGCTRVLVYLIKEHSKYRAVRTFTLVSFIVFPLIGGIFTLFINGPSTVWSFFTIGLVFVFFDMRIASVSQDGLTRINNRRIFDDYLAHCINEVRSTKNLYLLMLDINKFKSINDTYGHQEGDYALILAANVLKKICADRDCFLARYGGDEFAILCWEKDDQEIYSIEKEILSSLRHQIASKKLPYTLTVSMGFEKRGRECMGNVPAFIKKADKALYKAKHLSEIADE